MASSFAAVATGLRPRDRDDADGQIMAAVALVKRVRKEGRPIRNSDLDAIRNICRCGTYDRIRDAIKDGASQM